MGINLHALAAEVVRASTSPDPGVMAQELVSQLDPDDYEDVLHQMARAYVREVVRGQRSTHNSGEAAPSSKVQAWQAWRRVLNSPEYVPSTDSWVFLRDATREQVLDMARHRWEKARANDAASKRYNVLADAMGLAGAATVGALGEDQLRDLLDPDDGAGE